MDVRYIPDMSEESKFEECQNIANTLYEELEYIEAESASIKSTSMHAEITDDILHFIVHYKIRIQKSIEAEDKMAHITLEVEL
jgi:hypothetical protein